MIDRRLGRVLYAAATLTALAASIALVWSPDFMPWYARLMFLFSLFGYGIANCEQA